jgi:hypothetical protein
MIFSILEIFMINFYSKTSFNSFKVFFYTYISNYKYVIRIKENTYKLTENGIKFLEYS